MSAAKFLSPRPAVVYPESDGKPMADNTLQFRWIVTIEGGIDTLYRDDPNVFVAGDLLWYPVEGDISICTAPDVLVVFGRPKGDRRSYKQWEEGGLAPKVVFEVLSPSNRFGEMEKKLRFYEQYGVGEYYVYDPDSIELFGYLRSGKHLVAIQSMQGWISPAMGIRFEMTSETLVIWGPDGRKFLSYLELAQQREVEAKVREQVQKEKLQVQKEKQQAEQERDAARLRAEMLADKLRAMGIDPETLSS